MIRSAEWSAEGRRMLWGRASSLGCGSESRSATKLAGPGQRAPPAASSSHQVSVRTRSLKHCAHMHGPRRVAMRPANGEPHHGTSRPGRGIRRRRRELPAHRPVRRRSHSSAQSPTQPSSPQRRDAPAWNGQYTSAVSFARRTAEDSGRTWPCMQRSRNSTCGRGTRICQPPASHRPASRTLDLST